MADGYDRFENKGSGGSSFVMGLLTGTVLGAGLGMLFAPKAGSELRHKIGEQAGSIANTASEGYRRAAESAGSWAEKGREMGRDVYGRAKEAVNRGADEAQRYAREGGSPSGAGSSGASGSGFGTENIRGTGTSAFGGSSEQTRGSGETRGSGATGSTPSTGNTSAGPGSTRRS